MALGIAAGERAQEDADDLAPLEQHEVERQARDLTAREPDHQEPALPRHRPERRLGERTADRVVTHVDTVLARQLLEPAAQVVGGVVDDVGGAVLAAQVELVVGRRGGDHPGAHQRSELDGGQPHSACRSEHE